MPRRPLLLNVRSHKERATSVDEPTAFVEVRSAFVDEPTAWHKEGTRFVEEWSHFLDERTPFVEQEVGVVDERRLFVEQPPGWVKERKPWVEEEAEPLRERTHGEKTRPVLCKERTRFLHPKRPSLFERDPSRAVPPTSPLSSVAHKETVACVNGFAMALVAVVTASLDCVACSRQCRCKAPPAPNGTGLLETIAQSQDAGSRSAQADGGAKD